MGYSYYDSPEGEDCFRKLWYTSKLAAGAGLIASSYDVLFLSHPQGYFQTIARYGYFTIPFVGMAATFTSTVCLATSLRKKDDKMNYFLGGVAAGCIGGVWQKSIFNGFRLATVFSFIAVMKKYSVEQGWVHFPQFESEDSTFRYAKQDHTLSKDPGRGWAVSES